MNFMNVVDGEETKQGFVDLICPDDSEEENDAKSLQLFFCLAIPSSGLTEKAYFHVQQFLTIPLGKFFRATHSLKSLRIISGAS